MYRIKTENFLLELEPKVYEGDFNCPVNTSLRVAVSSDGFSAACVLDMGVEDLKDLAAQLHRLYETLQGAARLEEPYGFHNYIQFAATKGGHIGVKGRLHNGGACGHEQELRFENELDQTYLREFVKELYADYGEEGRV